MASKGVIAVFAGMAAIGAGLVMAHYRLEPDTLLGAWLFTIVLAGAGTAFFLWGEIDDTPFNPSNPLQNLNTLPIGVLLLVFAALLFIGSSIATVVTVVENLGIGKRQHTAPTATSVEPVIGPDEIIRVYHRMSVSDKARYDDLLEQYARPRIPSPGADTERKRLLNTINDLIKKYR